MTDNLFAGSSKLTRFILRRDRILIIIWLAGIVGFTVFCGPLFNNLYKTDLERLVMAETMRNPAMIAMVGPVYGIDNYTTGALFSNMMLEFMAIIAAVMNIFFVTRHTRQDEESGRMEVIRSLPVGRLSNLTATMLAVLLVNVIMAVLTGLGLTAFGIDGMDFAGSMFFGCVMGITGLFFAAATALFCQLTANNRTASGFSFIFLMFLYLLRAAGDLGTEALSLLSPLGLILRAEVYVNNCLWPILVLLGITILVTALALYLAKIRDLGTGLLPDRPGKANAARLLSSPLGLAFRLLKTSIFVWAAAIFIFAAMYGSIFGDLESFISSNDMLKAIFAQNSEFSFVEQFIVLLMAIMSMLSTIPVLSFMQRVRGEEKLGRTEHLLSRSVSRSRQFAAYFIIASIMGAVLMLLTALGFWSVGSITLDTAPSLGTFVEAAMAYLPAIWVMLGCSMILIAYLPDKTFISYIYLGYSFFSVYIGSIAQLPEWIKKLTPFGHIPQIPVEEMDVFSLVVLIVIAVLLFVLSFAGYSKRDMQM